jgi:uncharacterized protein
MEFVVGFFIAAVIALTGVGAGTITAPVLILFLGVPADVAVGTALTYSALVKLVVAPVQIVRRQVDYRVLGSMLVGGLPGVVIGSILFAKIAHHGNFTLLYWMLGAIIIFTSSWHIFRFFCPSSTERSKADQPIWITALMLPIGAEVGFSSSGAGALGIVALLSLTSLPAAKVIGTDLVFGLGVTLVGSAMHIYGGAYHEMLLIKMMIGGIAGAIVGSGIAPRLPSTKLRFALSLWLLVLGIEICCRAAKS